VTARWARRALTRYASDLVVCTDGEPLGAEDAACIARTGATVRPEPIVRLEPRPDGLAVVFAAGPPLPRAALLFCTPVHVRSPLAAQLGCRFAANGLVETNASEGTGVRGLWVAGDASRSVLLAVVAAGEGATAAFAINRELLREDL
jgi:hypothetical protein